MYGHLPQTNKKFSARHMCEERVYQYYLPASMLGECWLLQPPPLLGSTTNLL